jgi:hypothetical protein
MYTIIGGDGKEYGPVSVEQVRAWIAGGRANLSTKVREVGTDTWKSIAECPEIAGSGAAASAGRPYAAQAAAGAVTLDFMSCYERSWTLLKANFWPLVGVNFLVCVIHAVLVGVDRQGLRLIDSLFGGVVSAGLFYYILLKIRGQPAVVGDAFAGFSKAFFKLIGIAIVKGVLITVGVICLILPGIYLAVAYGFTSLVAVDKGLGFWETMELSRRVVTRNWWRVFALFLLMIPVLIIGVLALGVGIFVALPFAAGAMVYAYEDMFNPRR